MNPRRPAPQRVMRKPTTIVQRTWFREALPRRHETVSSLNTSLNRVRMSHADRESRGTTGFWLDKMRSMHIMLLELEAVYKTALTFLRELDGKVARPHLDSQAVVALLSPFASRSPDPMQSVRCLCGLRDLHDIELPPCHTRSVAAVQADGLSRNEVLDDWRLYGRRFDWAHQLWGPRRPLRFWDLSTATEVELALEQDEVDKKQMRLPARHVRMVHRAAMQLYPSSDRGWQLLLVYIFVVFAFVTFGRANTGMPMMRDNVRSIDDKLPAAPQHDEGRIRRSQQ
eukprot:gene10768-biopygen11022